MKKKCVNRGKGGLARIQLALEGQSVVIAGNKCHFHCKTSIRGTREALTLLESVTKLRRFRKKLQGCIWASQRELLPGHRMLQEQPCLCYMAVTSFSKETLEACVPSYLGTPWLQTA